MASRFGGNQEKGIFIVSGKLLHSLSLATVLDKSQHGFKKQLGKIMEESSAEG